MYFPESFVHIMIISALVFIGIGSVVLIILLISDIRNKKLW